MKMKKNERNRTNMSLIKNKFKKYIFVIKILIKKRNKFFKEIEKYYNKI